MICGISEFSFFPYSTFENPETTENFYKLIFRGIKTIYLILSTFLSILCSLFTNFFFKELNRHLQFSKLSGIISWNSITGSLILYLVSFLSKIFPFQNVCKRTDFLQFKFFQYPKTLLLFYLMCLLQLQMSILICGTQTLYN